jgi:hypothetical protein
MRSAALAAVFVSALAAVACTAQSSYIGSPGDGGPPAQNGSLPLANADDLGGKCSGYGTSIGDTAAFPTDACPAGMCLVDARDGLELYCSADCNKVRCPEGWLCQQTSVGSRRACFKDPDAPTPTDKPDAAPVSWLDEKLPAYRVGTSGRVTASVRDFADPTKKNRDLVVLAIDGLWDSAGREFLSDPENRNVPRVAWISVVVHGPIPDEAATTNDFAQWHKVYPQIDKLLDPSLVKLAPAMKEPLIALPTFVALDAASLDYIGEQTGWTDIKESVEKWRDASK